MAPKFHYLDKPDNPYIRFVFRYRPKEILQADGIMPLDVPEEDSTDIRRPLGPANGKRADGFDDNGAPPSKRPRHTSVKEEPIPLHDVQDVDGDADEIEAILRAESVKSEPSAVPAQLLNVDIPTRRQIVIDVDNDVIDLTMED